MNLHQLTNKNQEFIHIATKQLIQDGKSDAEIKEILEGILPSIEENQKNGIPARSFLGAPTTWAAQFTQSPEQIKEAAAANKNTNPWLMWANYSLFWFGLLGLITGILSLTNSNYPSYGLLSLIVIGLGGGAILYATYYFVYRHIGKEKSQRPNMWKSIAILAALMIVWLALFSASSFLPAAINPVLSPLVLVIIGAIALAIRYYLKKKYNILSAMSAQAARKA